MASATARLIFSFHLSTATSTTTTTISQQSLPKPKPTPLSLSTKPIRPQFTLYSIDVSQEGKPTSDEPTSAQPTIISPSPPPPTTTEEEPEPEKLNKRRLEEKFAVLNTGIYECRSCGHKFDEAVGDPSYPIPPGLPFEKLPEDWTCPTCGAAKSFFASKSVEIAGFAQNQQYGLGGNTLTSGQKAVLIYGSLLFFFALFLSGYFLQ